MELKQIKDLMAAMGRCEMKKLRIKRKDFELELEREVAYDERPATVVTIPQGVAHMPIHAVRPPEVAAPPLTPTAAAIEAEAPGTFVTAPMVGTFYASSSPDADAFVKVGDKIDENSVVCIIEAMKVMNEVKSGVTGTISKILVENGQPVEFGSKMFEIS